MANVLNDSKVRCLVDAAIQQGFTLERISKSYRLIPADKSKKIVSFAATPSDCNFYWELRRNLKKSGFQEKD